MKPIRQRLDRAPTTPDSEFTPDRAWDLLLDLARTRRSGRLSEFCAPDSAPDVRDLLDLYLPICGASAERPITVGHLGQSIDGHIATRAGHSSYVTGQANLVHLHRLRALCDAVVVGAGTVANDDPSLTTRYVRGANPVRVIVDPRGRLADRYKVFKDSEAPTLIACDPTCLPRVAVGQVEMINVPSRDGRLDLGALLASLHERGLYGVFVEGGGVTVSRFLEANRLDRLHLTAAPVLIGSGRRGLQLPAVDSMAQCPRPEHRIFRMGDDILWDLDLRAPPADVPGRRDGSDGPLRIR
jgi:diaminohydroxyphosphoribosylaminopyrimidine deaminase/5-amino-6-(5-phosphoribosylamino)uracil reductase